MKIILSQDVANLGEEGDVRVVADGYARNFLIPKGMAVLCTRENLNNLEQKTAAIEKRKDEKKKAALGLKDRLAGENLEIAMPVGEKGKLFGAVTAQSIVDELNKIGIAIEKKKIDVPEHAIKVVGSYIVKVKLYGGEFADLKVEVKGLEKEEE
ncbi:MAG: 50S ribosomal protein L9 [Spirochaetales bacterium]|nr:50S ribosomal protein L9 [Spirochaetales bacterium]